MTTSSSSPRVFARMRNLERIRQVSEVAIRHGFGYFFERHNLWEALKIRRRVRADRYFRDLTYALQVPHARKYTRRGATGRHRLSRQSKYQSVPLPGSTGVQSASNRNLDPLDPF